MTDKAIWVTIEEPVAPEELENLTRTLESTQLNERYEIIVTSDRIDTIDMEELRELIE